MVCTCNLGKEYPCEDHDGLPYTLSLDVKLRELIQEWREMSAEKALFQDVNEAYVIDVCADQLEVLIGEKDDG